VIGAIEQDFGRRRQDRKSVFALFTTTKWSGVGNEGRVAMAEVSSLDPTTTTLMLLGLGLCLAYIFWWWKRYGE
jgi:hypothetical protein